METKLDTLTVCRICLQSSEEEMISIFETDADTQMCLYEKIESCGGIRILTDPELPTRICKKCRAFLTLVDKFRVMCSRSDKYLREFVCKPASGGFANEEEDGVAEYLMEYKPEAIKTEEISGSVVQVLQQAGHEIDESQTIDYEDIDEYAEMWLNEDANDIIEEVDSDSTEEFLPASTKQSPSKKTLGISSDGTAVIRVKSGLKEKQQHICDICGNAYPRKYALEAHMRRHRNERPFECEICHESFHLNFQLTRHIRKHTGARPYKCQYCNRTFADRSTMIKHERLHRNERPYICDTCGKSFTYSSVLKVHKLTHTGEKPFTCGICDKRFARAHHLRAHLETLLHQSDPKAQILIKQIKRHEENGDEDLLV